MERTILLLCLLGIGQFALAGTSQTESHSSARSKATPHASSQPYSPWYDHFWAHVDSSDHSPSLASKKTNEQIRPVWRGRDHDSHVDHHSAIQILQRQDGSFVTPATIASAKLPSTVTGNSKVSTAALSATQSQGGAKGSLPIGTGTISSKNMTLMTAGTAPGSSSSGASSKMPPFPSSNTTDLDVATGRHTGLTAFSSSQSANPTNPNTLLTFFPPLGTSSSRPTIVVPPFPMSNSTRSDSPTAISGFSLGTSIHTASRSKAPSGMPSKSSFIPLSTASFPFPNATHTVGPTVLSTAQSAGLSSSENSSVAMSIPRGFSSMTEIDSEDHSEVFLGSASFNTTTDSAGSTVVLSSIVRMSSSRVPSRLSITQSSSLVTALITTTDSQGHTTTSATVIRTSRPASITPPPSSSRSSSPMLSASLKTSDNGSWVYYGPELWNTAAPTIGCKPPCCISLPDLPQSDVSATFTWPVFKTSYLTLEGSADLVSVTEMELPHGGTFTLCSRPGAKFKIVPTWITVPPFAVPVKQSLRPFCAATEDQDKNKLTYEENHHFTFDPCDLQNVKPPTRHTMSLNSGAMWIRPHNWKEDPQYWPVGLCNETTVGIAIEPTAKLVCSAPAAVWTNKPAGPTCTHISELEVDTCPPPPPVLDDDDDSDFGICTGGLLGLWPFDDLICYCGLFGCATGCALVGCVNPCGILQLVPGVGIFFRLICRSWRKHGSLSDGGQWYPNPPGKPERPEEPPEDCEPSPVTNTIFICPGGATSCVSPVSTIATSIVSACSATASFAPMCAAQISVTPDDQDGQSGDMCPLEISITPDDQDGQAGGATCPIDFNVTPDDQDGNSGGSLDFGLPSIDLYGEGSAGKFHCETDPEHMVDYKKWFSPMAKVFCKRPPSLSTFDTVIGPRSISHQQWKFTGGQQTDMTVEIAAVGPPGEVKACEHYVLDSGNCEEYLERGLYQNCKSPTNPANIESGTISGGLCIAYSFEVFEHQEGSEPPTFEIPDWLWPYSIQSYGLVSPGSYHCEDNASQSINYKDYFSAMAKTFCRSPPAPDTLGTDKGDRTIWKKEWSYGPTENDQTSAVEVVALKSGEGACANYEFNFSNCEEYLDGLLRQKCPLVGNPLALISGSIAGGICISYAVDLSTKEGTIGLPPLFELPSWLWPFPIPIKKPGNQMTAHEFVISYNWDCDVEFDKLSSTPDCHAHWGLWTRWSQDGLITCDSLVDLDERRLKLTSEDALLPTAQTDSPLHIASFAGLPLDLSKSIGLAFEGDCISNCRFNLGTKDDFSDSEITCDVDDTCSKTKRFGCIAAPPNSTLDCFETRSPTGDRRFQTLFICNSSIPLQDPPSNGPWSVGHVLEPPTDLVLEDMPSANLLGFGSASSYEFGVFQAMSCPKASSGGGPLNGIVRTLQCRYYYALYATMKGTSMNECTVLNAGAVGDPHRWRDASMNISAFDPTWKDWYPVTPDYVPQYESFPHKANDNDTCAPNCFWSRIAHTGNPLSVIICKESPDQSKKPCFPARYQNCESVSMLDSKNSNSTCEINGIETTYWPIAYCNDKEATVTTPTPSLDKNYFLPGKKHLDDYSFAVYTFDCHDDATCKDVHFAALYAGPALTEMWSCNFTQPLSTNNSTWHYTQSSNDTDDQGYLRDPGDFPAETLPYKDSSSTCWSNCNYKKDTQRLSCQAIKDDSKRPCFPTGEVQCTLPLQDVTGNRLDCGYESRGQYYTPWAWCNAVSEPDPVVALPANSNPTTDRDFSCEVNPGQAIAQPEDAQFTLSLVSGFEFGNNGAKLKEELVKNCSLIDKGWKFERLLPDESTSESSFTWKAVGIVPKGQLRCIGDSLKSDYNGQGEACAAEKADFKNDCQTSVLGEGEQYLQKPWKSFQIQFSTEPFGEDGGALRQDLIKNCNSSDSWWRYENYKPARDGFDHYLIGLIPKTNVACLGIVLELAYGGLAGNCA